MSGRLDRRALISMFLGLSVLVFQCLPATAQEKGEPGAEDPEAALEAYRKASEPGPEHAKLKMRVGNWKIAGAFYMAPGAEPMRSEATSNVRPMMGGRYFRENYNGEFMGQKFTGFGVFGYDKGTKKYVSTWIDSMSTGMMYSEGTADESGDTISYVGEYFDPMRNGMVKTKYTVTLTSRKTHTSVMYEITPDGSERKVMELVYTRDNRVKGGKKAAKGTDKKDANQNKNKNKKKTDKKQEAL